MAKCYSCKKEIGILQFWLEYMNQRYGLRKYLHEKMISPLIHCPHCEQEIQPSALAAYGPLIIIGALVIVQSMANNKEVLSILNATGKINSSLFVWAFVILAAIWFLWWKFFVVLKEPCKFFWEKNNKDSL